MKKTNAFFRILSIIILLLLTAIPVNASSIETEDFSVTRGCHTIDAQVPLLGTEATLPNAYAAFLYDYENKTVLYAHGADDRNYPSSLVKIMTGLIVAERANMSEEITVKAEQLSSLPTDSLGINLQDGEIISMQNLLYAILVESANDAAVVAAESICGSQESFVAEMNRYAQELGCNNTNFMNVHGLHDPDQYSSARDIARILAKAAENEIFMDAFSTVNYTIPATNLSEARELSSGNFLMNDSMMTIYLDSRVTGGRSGIISTGERNLAVTAEYNDIKLISVVLGSFSQVAADGWSVVEFGSFKETTQLLNMGFEGYHSVQLFYADQALKQFKVTNGDSYVSTGILNPINILMPYGISYNDLTYRYNEASTVIHAPVKRGDYISTVEVWHNDVCLAQESLYALHDVNEAQAIQELDISEKPAKSGFDILLYVGIIVILLVVLLFGRRFIFRLMHNRRIRRHRKRRRRSH